MSDLRRNTTTAARLVITVNGVQLTGTLHDHAASRSLLELLPLELRLSDHGGVEKTGPLPAALALAGLPAGVDPDIGDIGYYAPGHDFVLYYGDQGYYPGIVVLGRLDGEVDELAAMDGDVEVAVRRA